MNAKDKQFVDTNVLVYCYDLSSKSKRERSLELVKKLWEQGNGCLSIQVLQEFYVTVTRKVPAPLAPEKAAEIIQDLSRWSCHIPDAEDILEAIEIQKKYGISFWDANIINSALREKCKVIWSEDLGDGQIYCGIDVKNPFI